MRICSLQMYIRGVRAYIQRAIQYAPTCAHAPTPECSGRAGNVRGRSRRWRGLSDCAAWFQRQRTSSRWRQLVERPQQLTRTPPRRSRRGESSLPEEAINPGRVNPASPTSTHTKATHEANCSRVPKSGGPTVPCFHSTREHSPHSPHSSFRPVFARLFIAPFCQGLSLSIFLSTVIYDAHVHESAPYTVASH